MSHCALCDANSPLRVSHIVPHFVLDSMKAESLTGFIRSIDQPNLRLQDCFKTELLCDACEQRFSRWETDVANTVFTKLRNDTPGVIRYENDLLSLRRIGSVEIPSVAVGGLPCGVSRVRKAS